MENYQARAPRFDLHLPLRYFSEDGLKTGYCVNVSESGLLAVFEQPVDLWLEGYISFFIDDQQFSIKARVARVDTRNAGLRFHPESDTERSAVQTLLTLAENSHQTKSQS